MQFHRILMDLLQGVPLRISSNFDGFAAILQGVPLRISSNFDGFAPILQGVPFRISSDFGGFVQNVSKTCLKRV